MADRKRPSAKGKPSPRDDSSDDSSPYRDEVRRADAAASDVSDEFVTDAEIEARELRRREKYS